MIVQQGNWITRARKAAGAKGPAQVDLLDDINQMVIVDDVSTWEFDALGGAKQMVAASATGPIAAQVNGLQIFNPIGSGIVALIYRVELMTSSASQVCEEATINVDAGGAFAPQFTPYHLDQRFGNTVPAVGDISSMIVRQSTVNAFPATVNLIARLFAVLGAITVLDRRVVIPPGVGYSLRTTVVNTSLTANVYWKERVLESGEERPS